MRILASCLAVMFIGFAAGRAAAQPEVKFEAADARESDLFGIAIDVRPGYAFVGAQFGDGSDVNSGAVYVFEGVGREWREAAKITASNGRFRDFFGYAVSANDDCISVGAPGFGPRDDWDTGAVYVYCRSSDDWVESAFIEAPEGQRFSFFGSALDFEDERILIGAPGQNGAGTASGAAFLMARSEGGWDEIASFEPESDSLIKLGSSVCLSGSVVALGAPDDPSAGSGAGSVFVYVPSDSGWVSEGRLVGADTDGDDHFGASLACDDSTIIVGAPDADVGAPDAGAVYVFERRTEGWTQVETIRHPEPEMADGFGFSVNLRNDTLAIGVPRRDSTFSNVGSAFVTARSNGTWTRVDEVFADDAGPQDNLGTSVALGPSTVFAGAPLHDGLALASGAAYAFDLTKRLATIRFVTDAAGLEAAKSRFGGLFDLGDKFAVPVAISLVNADSLQRISVSGTLGGEPLAVELGNLDNDGDGSIDRIPTDSDNDSPAVVFWVIQAQREGGFEGLPVHVLAIPDGDNGSAFEATETVTFETARHPREVVDRVGRGFAPERDGFSFSIVEPPSFDSLVSRIGRLTLVDEPETAGFGLLQLWRKIVDPPGTGMAETAARYFANPDEKPATGDPFGWTVDDAVILDDIHRVGIASDMSRSLDSPTEFALLDARSGLELIVDRLRYGLPVAATLLDDSLATPTVVTSVEQFAGSGDVLLSLYDIAEPGLAQAAVVEAGSGAIDYRHPYPRVLISEVGPDEPLGDPSERYFANLTQTIRTPRRRLYAVMPETPTGTGFTVSLTNTSDGILVAHSEDINTFGIDDGTIDRAPMGNDGGDSLTVFSIPSGGAYVFRMATDSTAWVRFERYQVLDSLVMAIEPGFELPAGAEAVIDESVDPWTIAIDVDRDGQPDEFVPLRKNALPTERMPPELAQHSSLGSAYPNPFSSSTTIPFELTSRAEVTVTVHDMLGRVVAILIDEVAPPGRHSVRFGGSGLPSGTYFYRIETDGSQSTGKVTLIR